MAASPPTPDTFARVEKLMRRDLKLGEDIEIDEAMPFFGSNADIDSLDILLLLGSIEKEFGLRIPSEAVGREVFQNVGTLVRYVDEHRDGGAGGGAAAKATPGGQSDLLARLPHGESFRFVSRVLEVAFGRLPEKNRFLRDISPAGRSCRGSCWPRRWRNYVDWQQVGAVQWDPGRGKSGWPMWTSGSNKRSFRPRKLCWSPR